ncbi:MAG: hypothetical protein ACXWCZ_06780, partial [Flavisolibacter sp.]
LEFARNAYRLQYIRLFMQHDEVVLNIFLDFLFIAAYTWFFITACAFIAEKNKWEKWSRHFKGIAIAAALFDVLENFLMLLVWNQRFSADLIQVVYYCAAIKFILVGMVVVYLIISVPFLFKKSGHRN